MDECPLLLQPLFITRQLEKSDGGSGSHEIVDEIVDEIAVPLATLVFSRTNANPKGDWVS